MKKIYIPHLHYIININRFKNPPPEQLNAKAFVQSDDPNSCSIFIKDKCTPPDLAHEIVHILQFIALNRNIDFKLEQEHFGYLMQYIMAEIMGYKWK